MNATLPARRVAPDVTLADLVLDEPRRARLLANLGLDYCCQGGRTLAVACEQRGLDAQTIVAVLEADRGDNPGHGCERDWREASTAELIDHIVAEHHDWLRHELPVLEETVAAVVRAHADEDPRLNDLARVHHDLAAELLAHLDREEQLLFPACRTLDAGQTPAAAETLLAELEDDHGDVGRALVRLRELTDDFRPESARCGTHARLLDGLRRLEPEVHKHVHEENNVLFPRIRALLAGDPR